MTLWRAQLRDTGKALVAAALEDGGSKVSSSKDTPVPSGSMPQIVFYVDDRKIFDYGAAPQCRTHATVTIEVDAEGATQAEAEALLDTLCETIENALFGTPEFVRLFEMIDSCDSFTEYRGVANKKHLTHCTIEIKGHTSEVFEPPLPPDLAGFNIYVDSISNFDPNGDYPDREPFGVAPAPRERGPDGRPEITQKVDLT